MNDIESLEPKDVSVQPRINPAITTLILLYTLFIVQFENQQENFPSYNLLFPEILFIAWNALIGPVLLQFLAGISFTLRSVTLTGYLLLVVRYVALKLLVYHESHALQDLAFCLSYYWMCTLLGSALFIFMHLSGLESTKVYSVLLWPSIMFILLKIGLFDVFSTELGIDIACVFSFVMLFILYFVLPKTTKMDRKVDSSKFLPDLAVVVGHPLINFLWLQYRGTIDSNDTIPFYLGFNLITLLLSVGLVIVLVRIALRATKNRVTIN